MKVNELDKKYDFGNVPLNIELKAAFLGKEDDLIIVYLKKFPNKRGANMPHLILYFCFKYGLLGERCLKNRLKHLIKMGLIKSHKESGLIFYQIK